VKNKTVRVRRIIATSVFLICATTARAQENPDTLALDVAPAPALVEMQAQESAEATALETNALPAVDQALAQETPGLPALEVTEAPVADQMPTPETRNAAAADMKPAIPVDQLIYKGVVGNLLEGMPIDPDKRVQLQKTNAVVSNIAAGRTLAMMLGVANPVLMIGGLVWGMWSASQIKPAELAARAPDSICVDNDVAVADAANVVLTDTPRP